MIFWKWVQIELGFALNMLVRHLTVSLLLFFSTSCVETFPDRNVTASAPSEYVAPRLIAPSGERPYIESLIDQLRDQVDIIVESLENTNSNQALSPRTQTELDKVLKQHNLLHSIYDFPAFTIDERSELTSDQILQIETDIDEALNDVVQNAQPVFLDDIYNCAGCLNAESVSMRLVLDAELDQIISQVSLRETSGLYGQPREKLKSLVVYALIEATYRYIGEGSLRQFLTAANSCGHACTDIDARLNWSAASLLIKHSIYQPELHPLFRDAYTRFSKRTGRSLIGLYTFEDFLAVWGYREGGQVFGSYFGCGPDGKAIFDPPLENIDATTAIRQELGLQSPEQVLRQMNESGACR